MSPVRRILGDRGGGEQVSLDDLWESILLPEIPGGLRELRDPDVHDDEED